MQQDPALQKPFQKNFNYAKPEKIDPSSYALLTDILGTEDHYGDMDFKVAGTAEGVTAIQVSHASLPTMIIVISESLQQSLV